MLPSGPLKVFITTGTLAGFTVRNAVVSPKDSLDTYEKCGVVHECSCEVCRKRYIGRFVGERVEEHAKSLAMGVDKLSLSQHQVNSGYRMDSKSLIDQMSVLAQGLSQEGT